MSYLIFCRSHNLVRHYVWVVSWVLMFLVVPYGFWAMFLLADTIPNLIWRMIEWDLLRQNKSIENRAVRHYPANENGLKWTEMDLFCSCQIQILIF